MNANSLRSCSRRCLNVGFLSAMVLMATPENTLYAADLVVHPGDPWADEIVDASPSLDASGVHNDPLSILGQPATTFFDSFFQLQHTVSLVVPPFNLDAPSGETLITTLNSGQFIKAKFDQPVTDDPFNPHGIDFIVFGNAFFTAQGAADPDTDMGTFLLANPTGISAEPVTVAVSASGIGDPTTNPEEWYVYATGPFADTAYPTNAFDWDDGLSDWGAMKDFTKPVDPLRTTGDFSGQTVSSAIKLYGRSGGGTGFDLAESGFAAIQYVYLTSAGGEVDAIADATPDISWQQFHGTQSHAGAWNGAIRTMATLPAWSSGDGLVRASQPALSEDGSTVFVLGSAAIHAIDAYTGDPLWSSPVNDGAAFGSNSSPVHASGFVYFAGGLEGEATVYKMNADNGSTLRADGGWVRELAAEDVIVNASVTVYRDVVYLHTNGGFTPAASRMYALDASDGSDRWVALDGGNGAGAPAIDAMRNLLYDIVFVDGSHTVRAYHLADGSTAWTSDVATADGPFSLALTFADDRLYLQDFSFAGDGTLYALDATDDGSLLWTAPTPDSGNAAITVSPDGRSFTAGNFSGPGMTRGYDSEGNEMWTFNGGGGWQVSVAWADGVVFTGDQSENNLYLLDAGTGAIRRQLVGSGPLSFGEDRFFSVGTDGILYAYELKRLNDFDEDGDIDLADFAVFDKCANTSAGLGEMSELCMIADSDADGDVDLHDFAVLQIVFTVEAE